MPTEQKEESRLMRKGKELARRCGQGWRLCAAGVKRAGSRLGAAVGRCGHILSRGRNRAGEAFSRWKSKTGEALARWRGRAGETLSRWRSKAGSVLSGWREKAKKGLEAGRSRAKRALARLPLPKRLYEARSRRLLNWCLLSLSPLILTFCCQLITLRDGERTVLWMEAHPVPVCVTVALLFLAEFILATLTGRPVWAVGLLALPITALALASTLKELANGIPLLISDLSMAAQAGAIAGFLKPGMSWGGGTTPALCILGVLLLILALLGVGTALKPGRYRPVCAAGAALILCLTLFTAPLRSYVAGAEGETQAGRNDRLGFLLGMYSAGMECVMSQPGDYTEDNLNRILLEMERNAEPVPEAGERPNVVLVVSESFFDVTRLPQLKFRRDPLLNFHALSRVWPTGTFLSNTFGGGTGNVEMEILTAIPSAFLGAGESLTTLSDQTAYSRLPSVVKAFSAQDYETVMVHAYDDSLYNRKFNLPRMGFDRLVYQKDFPKNAQEAGGYLSDHALVQELIRQFEAKGDEPIFLYGLTMENHPPYYGDKFRGEDSGLGIRSRALEKDGLGVVDALAHGLRDADAALGELLDYFAQQEEPVLVVFLGDHLPGLYLNTSNSSDIYTALGYSPTSNTEAWDPEELKRMHSTDFIVWNNYEAELEVPDTISCTQLGPRLLSWAGVERPLYFQWVERAGREVELYRTRLFVAGDGTPYHSPTEESRETVEAWRNLVYDCIYGSGYVSAAVTELSQR